MCTQQGRWGGVQDGKQGRPTCIYAKQATRSSGSVHLLPGTHHTQKDTLCWAGRQAGTCSSSTPGRAAMQYMSRRPRRRPSLAVSRKPRAALDSRLDTTKIKVAS